MVEIRQPGLFKFRSQMISGLLAFIMLLSCNILQSQQLQAGPFQPGARTIRTIVDSLTSQISKYYIEKEAAATMSAYLKKRYREGAYNKIRDPHILAGMLTNDVLKVQPDEHFHVEYNPALANELSGNIEDVPNMVAEKLQIEKKRNFGFRKAEILPGNIGYLEISSFSRLNQFSKATADAALQLLSNSSAIIIDLRYGAGGSPDMVTYILSHFFKERTHITDIYIRNENVTLPYYTTPDSSYGELTAMPLYVLTSYKTFSAAEGLTYALKTLHRATIVGETTRGGAHTVSYRPVSNGFVCDIPFGKAISPVTKNNWERTGIVPDIQVPAGEALETAEQRIFENAYASAKDSISIQLLRWQHTLLKSLNHPHTTDSSILRNCSGVYGTYTVTYTEGCLYYQKAGKARFPLIPMSDYSLRPRGNETFMIEFQKDQSGKINRLATFYDDGRKEYAERSR